ncbi:hypothetical protein ACFFSH_05635 [Streptomyces filamentosus]|uniref:ACT domain-containing protein n=1 Tax=Streptomyces filamentosus TaxID=67294 RepID=A0A919BY83_STRFL|nr:hypothetical protein [Streptomyces filamentosus]GHG25040.1 hypothetical protein GCM10017667_71160 [Streptomyces filamentosus]
MTDDTAPHVPADTCTMVVALRDTPGALARITATLAHIPVLALAYAVTSTGTGTGTSAARAVAEIRLPRTHAARARNKLNRMVDTLTVSEPDSAGAHAR